MAIVVTLSNHFKYQKNVGNIDFTVSGGDVFKIILMNTTFSFDKDAHATLADVTSNQIAGNGGYVQNDKTLSGISISENDTDDRFDATWDDPSWTATDGTFPTTGAAIVYDDTTSDDTVMGCIDFGADHATADGGTLKIEDITYQDS